MIYLLQEISDHLFLLNLNKRAAVAALTRHFCCPGFRAFLNCLFNILLKQDLTICVKTVNCYHSAITGQLTI